MEYLHKHKEEFINAVNLASEYFHILPVIVEKDYYYVTMILREIYDDWLSNSFQSAGEPCKDIGRYCNG